MDQESLSYWLRFRGYGHRVIESQILNATREFAGLLVQEQQREFTNGLQARVGSEEPIKKGSGSN